MSHHADTATTYRRLRAKARRVAEREGYLGCASFDRELAEVAEEAMSGTPIAIANACGMLRDMIEWYSN